MSKLFFLMTLVLAISSVLTFLPKPAQARSLYGNGYRNYSRGGSLYYQRGYSKSNGTYVQPHLKTRPDSSRYNNRRYLLGY